MTIGQRFWEKVDCSGGPDACWVWRAARSRKGYGRFSFKRPGGPRANGHSHRVAYELTYGDIPNGLWVLHSCDNPPCVNPAHLRLGTHLDNIADWLQRGRRTDRTGEKHPRHRLNVADVRAIRLLNDASVPKAHIARRFRVSSTQIRRIVRREGWSHVA